ncbi:MAG: ABC transporter permease [Rhizobiales bacterium 65-79]|jgi:NitT/TauT family transport system permease protein|nr:ABC transporter permease subunit [Hyphomicrobiales bacterium]OJU04287.1 MAG: ABC transporter permease [Rhizobiales bacterium 65-79]
MNRAAKALAVPALLLVAAEIATRLSGTTSLAVAPPSSVAVALLAALGDGTMLAATRDTLACAFGGLFVGGAIGLVLGLLFGLVRPLDRLMELTVEAIRPIPSVALIPIGMLSLGFGYSFEIAIVAFACVWTMLIMTRAAIGGIEPRLLEVSRALRLSTLQRIFKIVIPAALPRIIVAFRLAAGFALVVAVTVEIAANPQGMGYGILIAQQSLSPQLMLAYLLWIGLVGYGLNVLLSLAQQRLLGRAAMGEVRQ